MVEAARKEGGHVVLASHFDLVTDLPQIQNDHSEVVSFRNGASTSNIDGSFGNS